MEKMRGVLDIGGEADMESRGSEARVPREIRPKGCGRVTRWIGGPGTARKTESTTMPRLAHGVRSGWE